MKTMVGYMEKYAKEIIISIILFALTCGFWGMYKLYKYKKGS